MHVVVSGAAATSGAGILQPNLIKLVVLSGSAIKSRHSDAWTQAPLPPTLALKPKKPFGQTVPILKPFKNEFGESNQKSYFKISYPPPRPTVALPVVEGTAAATTDAETVGGPNHKSYFKFTSHPAPLTPSRPTVALPVVVGTVAATTGAETTGEP